MDPSDGNRPIIVPAGGGTTLDVLGVTHKLTGPQTGGALCIFESSFEGGTGNRLHVHRREDEFAYVLDGALEVRLVDETLSLEAGGLARLPRNLAHALRNPLATSSRYLFLAVPAGLDAWFDAIAQASQAGTLDDALYAQLSHDFDLEWLE
ncbi:MAG TPA: cupin domain-containing protein [Candidatus Limnocylindrales bacterium]|jgi:quercetin dioxygenase-like cupin family protein